MTGNAQKQIFRFFGLIISVLLLFGINSPAVQEKISPLSDYQYKRDFAQYEVIKKEADSQKRADLLLAYLKERPISKLLLYCVTDYIECIRPQLQQDPAKAVSRIEGLLAILPTEKTIKDAEIPVGAEEFVNTQLVPSRNLIDQNLLAAYYQAKNYPKAAEMLEKFYTRSRDKNLLPDLAKVYKFFNTDKYVEYSRKILAEFPMEQSYTTALELVDIDLKKNDIKAATELLSKIMSVYGEKVPPNVQESAWNTTRAFAYGVIASGIYASKDYPKAIEAYGKVARFDPKREDAYYFIGMSKWQTKDQVGAIDAFAKCVVLSGKNYGAKAKQYMEDLYKAEHSGSLDGIDKVLAKAKSELGIN